MTKNNFLNKKFLKKKLMIIGFLKIKRLNIKYL